MSRDDLIPGQLRRYGPVWYRAAERTAIVAGAFCLVVAALLAFNFAQRLSSDPLDPNALGELKAQLKDAADNSAIAAHNGKPAQYYQRGKPSPFFGSSKTEADMTPRDQVIGEIVDAELQKFLVKFVPTEITAQVTVKAGAHEMSEAGVRALRIDDYETALANFKAAIAEEPDDHKSCFGAGVCCEKLGNADDAAKYYKMARSIKPKEAVYGESLDRVSTVG